MKGVDEIIFECPINNCSSAYSQRAIIVKSPVRHIWRQPVNITNYLSRGVMFSPEFVGLSICLPGR